MSDLSGTMEEAVALADSHPEGKLIRYRGGRWAPPTEDGSWTDRPDEHVGTRTVVALLRRDVFRETGHRTNRQGSFVTEVQLDENPLE